MRELDPACPPGTFDSRTSTSEPFRRAIHRRGESCRPRSDDDEIVDARLVDGLIEAEAVRDLRVRRIP